MKNEPQRRTLTASAAVMAALLVAACSAGDRSPTSPPLVTISSTALDNIDNTGYVRVCKAAGPAGSYVFETTVAGGGAHLVNFGTGPTLTLDFAGTETCLNTYVQLRDPSWTDGLTAGVTVKELVPDGVSVFKIEVWNFGVFPAVLLETITNSNTVTVTAHATTQIKLRFYNEDAPPPPPVVATCYSITAVSGIAITPVQLSASGGAGAPYTFGATGLPDGLTLSSDGVLSGTPTVTGTFTYTVIAQDAQGNSGTSSCQVNVDEPPGAEGCTPGYWKQSKHFDSWVPTGFTTGQSIGSVFSNASIYGLQNVTLLAGLSFEGGSSLAEAAQILLRASIAAVLNAGSSGVDYALTVSQIVSQVNAALASGSRDTILGVANRLDVENNRGCTMR